MNREKPVGISTVAKVAIVMAVIVVAGSVAYLSLGNSNGPSTSGSSTGQAGLSVTAVPSTPLIAPGQTQNYSALYLQGSGASREIGVEAFPPSGLSFLLNQTSVELDGSPLTIPVVLKAAPDASPGTYSVTVQVSEQGTKTNETVKVAILPMLVVMEYPSFYPQNVTVPRGTQVTWINLNSNIGCCDPGQHDVSFLSGANATSPLLSRLQTWNYTLGADGEYNYFCTVHPIMTGRITVTG